MPQTLSFDVEVPLAFNDAVGRVKDALKQEGFGILTEIDLRAAFREKLGRVIVNHEPTLAAMSRPALHKSDELDGPHKDADVAIHEAFDIARRRLEDVARRQRGDVKTRAAAT